MNSDERWKQHKLEQLERLRRLTFQLAEYKAPSADWDHDHCEGCQAKFASFEAPEVLQKRYFTAVRPHNKPKEVPEFIKRALESGHAVMAKPDNKMWVCPDCFDEFRNTLEWKVKS